DADPSLGERREARREPHDGCLGGGVLRARGRGESEAGRRGEAPDRSAAALGQRLDGEVDPQHYAAEIEIQIPRPVLDRRLWEDRLFVVADVVDEDVETAVAARGFRDHLLAVG